MRSVRLFLVVLWLGVLWTAATGSEGTPQGGSQPLKPASHGVVSGRTLSKKPCRCNSASLEIYEQALGQEHPGLAASINNLAGLPSGYGVFDQALPLTCEP